jgi:hypothetical protein
MEKLESVRSHQSNANKEGKKFEIYVKTRLNNDNHLVKNRIRILDNKDLNEDLALKNRTMVRLRNYVLPQNPLHLIAKDSDTGNPLALICCKVSLHGRIPETLFYSWFYKTYLKKEKLNVVLVTPDKGRQSKPDEWRSEWGSQLLPTQCRILAEHFLDGVYIDNNYLKERFGVIGNTQLDNDLHSFSTLVDHLISWKRGD